MTFKYRNKESVLYDRLIFPKLLYVTEEEHERYREFFYDNVDARDFDIEEYKQFVKDAQEDLKPFEDPLLGFYADETISSYDFPVLLMRAYSIRGFSEPEPYLDQILDDDERNIKKNMIVALLTVEASEENLSDEEARVRADALIDDREALTKLVRATPTTENYRWILMLLLDTPKAYLTVYRDLLRDIEPIFNRYLKRFAPKYEAFEETVVKPLTENPEKAFAELTQQIIPLDLLEEENLFITSFVDQTRFSILTFGEDRYILFGLEMRYGFKRLADFEQNKRENRSKVFKALSDNTRYEVLRHLARGITSTKDIASSLGVSSATVTYHLNAFLQTKIIRTPKSKNMKYVVDFERLEQFWNEFMDDVKNQ